MSDVKSDGDGEPMHACHLERGNRLMLLAVNG